MKRFLFLSLFFASLIHAHKPVYITHIVNHSSSDFCIQNSKQIIPAYETVTISSIDVGQEKLTLIPEDKKSLNLIITQNKNSGIEQIRSTLTSCLVQKKIHTLTKVPRELLCCAGNNIVQIQDYDPLANSEQKKFFIQIFPTRMIDEIKTITRYGDASTVYQSPFSASGTCRKTNTSVLIPTFTESGTICSETYESTNFPNKSATVDRPYLIYLPYEYFDNPDKLYPVLYHLHGTPSNPEDAVDRVTQLLDLLISDERIVPTIVVFPNGNAPVDEFMGVPLANLPQFYIDALNIVENDDSIPSFWANSSQLGDMETDIIFTLCDHIDATYQTKRDKQFRGINGFSGGGGAHQMVLPHSDRFGSVSSNSGYGLDWESEVTIVEDYDDIYAGILYSFSYTNTHLADLDPFDEDNYYLVTRLPWIYNVATSLSPNAAAPYKADLPVDVYGNIVSSVQTAYISHSAVKRAELYADDIKANNLKIYFDAGALDFFYNVPGAGYYFLVDVNATGASYYNGTANNYCQALTTQGIKHEFVSFRGNHNGQSNIQTMSAFLFHSAIFSSNYNADDERIKFVGNGNILLEENSSMLINQETSVGVETMSTYTSFTDFIWNINDHAKLQLGNPGQRGGTLQIGNTHDKFDIENNPSLGDHVVSCTFVLDGAGAELQINNHGILGLAAGIQGQEGTIPNQFVMNSLSNVSSINIDIQEGTLKHNQIISGHNEHSALLAVGPSSAYTFTFDEVNSSILGGGNIIKTDDADLMHSALSTGRFNQEEGEKIDFETDHVDGSFSGQVPQGMREYQQTTETNETLFFVNEPVSLDGQELDALIVIPTLSMTTYKSHAHKNTLDVNAMSSKPLMRDLNKTQLAENNSQDQFYDYLKLEEYLDMRRKRSPFGKNHQNETTLVYLEEVDELDNNSLIVRVKEKEFPPLTAGIDNGQKIGAIGIILNRESPRELVQVYDLEEHW